MEKETIVVAILAKDKAHCLPFYLQCIYNQTFPKKKTHLYIRTNDNNDNTESILQEFIKTHGVEYASVVLDTTNISESLKKYGHHEWNNERFTILGKIRQESIEYAKTLDAHYFVADCDNFITPDTLNRMFSLRSLGVIAPLLVSRTAYSNYHYDVDKNGYYQESPFYMDLLLKRINGIVSVKVVHCTYFIHSKHLVDITYNDGTSRYEYVIFSDALRKKNIPQYLDNTSEYGFLVFSDNTESFEVDKSAFASLIERKF